MSSNTNNLAVSKKAFEFILDATTTDLETDPIPVLKSRRLSGVLMSTGTLNGTFGFEVSADGENWAEVSAASRAFDNPNGSNLIEVVNLRSVPGSVWRLVASRTSGTSTVTFYYSA